MVMHISTRLMLVVAWAILEIPLRPCVADDLWNIYPGGDGPDKGKNIVLISGDEEYRSEEGLPELAKILSRRHGFTCTVLFAIDPKTGNIDPETLNNIPGLAALDSADLMIIQTRWRDLPDDQMKHIDDYLMAGKPVIGLRTATHPFKIAADKPYARYSWDFNGKPEQWTQGFGRLVFGETWIAHHGAHKSESTRGIIAPGAADSPLVNGIQSGEIWGPTDVYAVRLPLPGDAQPIILGQVLQRKGPAMKPEIDPFYGMRPTDEPKPDDPKNNPMMPIAWLHSYQLPDGKPGQAFIATMGASIDLTNGALRRLLVNATYHLLKLPVPAKADVDIMGKFTPSTFGFGGYKKGRKPADYR
jgi:hypothetical protein